MNYNECWLFSTFVLSPLVAPWFDGPTQIKTLKRRKGDSVSLVCSAKGYPLEITWKMEKIKDGAVNAPAYISKNGKRVKLVRQPLYCRIRFFCG